MIDGLRPIALDRVMAAAALQNRVDTKYVVSHACLARLMRNLEETHAVLEHEERRSFVYRTSYFDSPALENYRAHVQGRRRRFKARSREYVSSRACVFEVKLKGARGRTVKSRMPHPIERRSELTAPARAFVEACLLDAYGHQLSGPLVRVLDVDYERVTLVDAKRGERLTCDTRLRFASPAGAEGRMSGDVVILESKSVRGGALADQILRELGVRPVCGWSKYCLGIGLTHPAAPANDLRRVLQRYFDAA